MRVWLLFGLLVTGLAAQEYRPPEPVLVRFQCQPPVEHVFTKTDSEVTYAGQENTFRFSVESPVRRGDLLPENDRRFRLVGNGFQGSVELSQRKLRESGPSPVSVAVSDWHAQSRAQEVGYILRRAAPLWTAGGLGLLGLLVLRHKRGARLARLRARERVLAQLVQPSSDPLVGSLVGPYRLLARLGAGGMARVYRAVPDDSLDESRVCALKIVRPERDSPEFRLRFQREIQVTMTLDHPNLIRVVDFGSQEELDYLATELIIGTTLKEKIPPAGLPLDQALAYFLPLLEGLEYAHARGIVHRDLKPDNVMVDQQGRVKLMDFGLARNHEVAVLTVAGGVMGTPDYMAPEQLGERPHPDPMSDQYSAGLILYRLLCGRLPFDDQDTMALIYATVHHQPPPPRQFRPDLPDALEQIILRTLAKAPSQRFADITSLREALTVFA